MMQQEDLNPFIYTNKLKTYTPHSIHKQTSIHSAKEIFQSYIIYFIVPPLETVSTSVFISNTGPLY
ncbi:hypothetical protein DsansV1_C04g0046261 [Dioscorea sansibarensis]